MHCSDAFDFHLCVYLFKYGSEENCEYLENPHNEAFVKFNNFHKEQTKKWKENPKTKGKKKPSHL